MRVTNMFLALLGIVMITGCSSYIPQELTVNHPAHPAAQVGAVAPRSKTLTYTAADLLSASMTWAAADSGGHDVHHAATANAPKTVTGEGSVVALVPATGQLVLQHGEIKGFMDAMTMGYPTEPSSLPTDPPVGRAAQSVADSAAGGLFAVWCAPTGCAADIGSDPGRRQHRAAPPHSPAQ